MTFTPEGNTTAAPLRVVRKYRCKRPAATDTPATMTPTEAEAAFKTCVDSLQPTMRQVRWQVFRDRRIEQLAERASARDRDHVPTEYGYRCSCGTSAILAVFSCPTCDPPAN